MDCVYLNLSILVFSLTSVLIIVSVESLHACRESLIFTSLYTGKIMTGSDFCILFAQAPVMFISTNCSSFLNPRKNNTSVAYCGLSTVKCQHRNADMATSVLLTKDLNSSAFHCFFSSKLPTIFNLILLWKDKTQFLLQKEYTLVGHHHVCFVMWHVAKIMPLQVQASCPYPE